MEENEKLKSIPEPGFESLLRFQILRNLRELPEFEEFIRQDPQIALFLNMQGGLEKFLVEMIPSPESWTYLMTIYFYYELWYFNSTEFGLGALMALLKKIYDIIQAGIEIDFKPVIDEIEEFRKEVKDGFTEIRREINYPITGLKQEIVESIAGLSAAITFELQAATGVLDLQLAELVTISGETANITRLLTEHLAPIPQKLDELPEKIVEAFENREEEFIKKVAKEVNRTIVGESYFKWSATSQFYPSMIFVFAETDYIQYPRRSQVKVRLNVLAEDFTEEMIQAFKARLAITGRLTYNYGNIRCNYVSADKRFKTNVFTSSKEEGVNLLNSICFIIDENFVEDNLSVTEGWRRPALQKRTAPLGDNPAEQQNYSEVFQISLVRVTIYVNGLRYPVELYYE